MTMSGYTYFQSWFAEASYTADVDYVYHHNFRQVARAAIDASYDEQHQAALELKQHAVSIMPQSTRNMDESARHFEQKMVRIVDDNWRRYNGEQS